jgi:hypothetical protein
MKQFVFLAAFVLAAAQLGAAPICSSGTLADFIALGSPGCMIGTNTLFDFKALSGISRATLISSSSITVNPAGASTNPSLTAQVTATAGPGNLLEAIFTYKISGNSYTGETITLANASASSDGAVTDIQNICRGGSFGVTGVTGCSGTPGNLLLLGTGSDAAAFPSVALLNITDDITLDGGLMGSASGATVTGAFTATPTSAIPEPATYLLSALGIAVTALRKLRICNRASSS